MRDFLGKLGHRVTLSGLRDAVPMRSSIELLFRREGYRAINTENTT